MDCIRSAGFSLKLSPFDHQGVLNGNGQDDIPRSFTKYVFLRRYHSASTIRPNYRTTWHNNNYDDAKGENQT